MAKARSNEWKIAQRICDDLYPEHTEDKTIIGQVVREISQIREDEAIRVANEFEKLAAEMLWEGVPHVPFAILKKACQIADKPIPEDPHTYLRELFVNGSTMVERQVPAVMYRR